MKLIGYGVTMRLMDAAGAEQMRQWRNSDFVQAYLHRPQQISYEQQQQWFDALDRQHNYHFIMEAGGQDIGFCSLKNINFAEHSCEPGLFIVEESHLNSPTGIGALITLLDYGHLHLGIKHYYGHVLKSNKRAYANYEAIGAVITGSESDKSVTLELTNYSLNMPAVVRAHKLLVNYFKCSEQIEIIQ